MAIMIPKTPREHDAASAEGVMFEALKSLPDDYYVFHSVSLFYKNQKFDNHIARECDFVVFNPNKGLLCIEAKNGNPQYTEGVWLYQSGDPMSHDGPYNQVRTYMYHVKEIIKYAFDYNIFNHCKILNAVWFPAISANDFFSRTLPLDVSKDNTLTKEALQDPQRYIDHIFDTVGFGDVYETRLSNVEVNKLIGKILAPEFKVFANKDFNLELQEMVFERLQNDQNAILDFTEEQKTAIINGAAGTGKTVVALEKAKRHANNGEKVLFLCYNRKLKDYLEATNPNSNIDFYTIDGFACKLCNTREADYNRLGDKLLGYLINDEFPYKHVIIDEGQDFGKNNIEETSIIDILHDIIVENDNGTFYVFYDELQLVQSEEVPEYIKNADCKLTLYRNCRNTESIAKTSLKTINECLVLKSDNKRIRNRKMRMMDGALAGKIPSFRFVSESEEKCVDEAIQKLHTENVKDSDIVILTCKSLEKTCLKNYIKNGLYKGKQLITTCAKFKGLEARAVILVDVDKDLFFDKTKSMMYYVGTSRARLFLDVVLSLNEEDCVDILENAINYDLKIKNAKRDLATMFNARIV